MRSPTFSKKYTNTSGIIRFNKNVTANGFCFYQIYNEINM